MSFTVVIGSEDNVGGLNDRATSIRNYSISVTFYEDSGYLGRKFRSALDYNQLGAISNNLHFGETWSDRISSYRR